MDTHNTACSLACLILADDGVAITADKIKSIVTASGMKDLPPFLPGLFANAFSNKDPKDIIMAFSAPAAGGAAPAPAASAGDKAAPAKAEEKKKEKPPPSESDDDMGLDLFG